MPRLLAISDLHLSFERNRALLEGMPEHPDDWLIVAGDVGESLEHMKFMCRCFVGKFARVLWVPGNHELWTERDAPQLVGESKYLAMVDVCRTFGVLTPEDSFCVWSGPGGPCIIALLFVPYDYTFVPDGVSPDDAVEWARQTGIRCADESLLKTAPYPSVVQWCDARVDISQCRLAAAAEEHPLVIVNHFPLRYDLVRIPAIPRFTPWCGTRRTSDWHTRFRAKVVVSGHLHVRATDWRDSVRFEEVSLGYPRQWTSDHSPENYLREILPGPAHHDALVSGGGPYWDMRR